MGTSAERSSANTEYYTRGDKIPGIQVGSLLVNTGYHFIYPLPDRR